NYIRAVNTGIVADPRNLAARPGGDPASGSLNFANRRAATIVPQQAFATAQPIGRAALPISDPAAQRARVTAQAPARPAGAAARAAGGGRAAAGAAGDGMAADERAAVTAADQGAAEAAGCRTGVAVAAKASTSASSPARNERLQPERLSSTGRHKGAAFEPLSQ